jgi:hypothetical protein
MTRYATISFSKRNLSMASRLNTFRLEDRKLIHDHGRTADVSVMCNKYNTGCNIESDYYPHQYEYMSCRNLQVTSSCLWRYLHGH